MGHESRLGRPRAVGSTHQITPRRRYLVVGLLAPAAMLTLYLLVNGIVGSSRVFTGDAIFGALFVYSVVLFFSGVLTLPILAVLWLAGKWPRGSWSRARGVFCAISVALSAGILLAAATR